jgi:hypothetical protein
MKNDKVIFSETSSLQRFYEWPAEKVKFEANDIRDTISFPKIVPL